MQARSRRSHSPSDDGHHGLEAGTSHSMFACQLCRRRKVKCDRMLPSCSLCLKLHLNCNYPSGAQKPGPRVGTTNRSQKHRRLSNVNARKNADIIPCKVATGGFYESKTSHNISYESLDPAVVSFPQHLNAAGSGYHQPGLSGAAESGSVSTAGLSSPNALGSGPGSLQDNANSITRGALSQIIHPSHEETLQYTNTNQLHSNGSRSGNAGLQASTESCTPFDISAETHQLLVDNYFDNMTAFSLFQRPYFQRKISNINSPVQRKALLASIFSFSARFCQHDSTKTQPAAQAQSQVRFPSSSRFHEIALHSIEASLEECQDGIPPLCILQALILTTFLQLIQGVRGRAWRSLGTCVRIAYELQLHLVDAQHDEMDTVGTGYSVERWSSDEERRRAWWTVWEFDVFASTVRRLPTAIDWTQNETFLPVEDELWFSDQFSPSCRLDHDPTARWKKLEKCGNQSPKAWFIVVNSIMRNAELLSNPRGLNSVSRPMERTNTTFTTTLDHEPSELVKSELMVLGNTLGCVMMALPPSLAHEEEYLSFNKPTRQMDSAKHGIHIMIQLTRFMIHHYEVFWTTKRDGSFAIDVGPELGESSVARNAEPTIMSARYSWSRYLEAADRIISLVRNCSSNHIRYVNPFLASTIWLAAAAQVVSKVFGSPRADSRVSESKLDLLKLNFGRYVDFWNAARDLQHKLDTLETRLETLRAHQKGTGDASNQAFTADASGTLPTDATSFEAPNSFNGANRDQLGNFSTPISSLSQPGTNLMPPTTPMMSNLMGSTTPVPSELFDVPYLSNFGNPTITTYDPFNSFNLGLDDLLAYGCS